MIGLRSQVGSAMKRFGSRLGFENPEIRHSNGKLHASLESLLGKTRDWIALNKGKSYLVRLRN